MYKKGVYHSCLFLDLTGTLVASGNKNNQMEIKIEIDVILRSANIRLT